MSTSNDTTSLKFCRRCQEYKPATHEFFHHDRYKKDGLMTLCRKCKNRVPPPPPPPEGFRRCGVCKSILPATREYFTGNKMGKGGLQNFCKPCGAAEQRMARKNRPDAYARYEKGRKNRRERANIQKIRSLIAYHNDPFKSQKLKVRNQKRRALLNKAGGYFTKDDLDLQYRSQKGRCWWCQKELHNSYHADHLIPLSRGGTNWPNNIVCSCAFCNCSKNSKLPYEWIGRLL